MKLIYFNQFISRENMHAQNDGDPKNLHAHNSFHLRYFFEKFRKRRHMSFPPYLIEMFDTKY